MSLEEELSMVIRGLRRLFCFSGYRLMEATFSADVVQVRLARDRRYRLRCPHCGAKAWVDRREAAALLNVGDTRLGRWDRAVLRNHLAPPDLDHLRLVMVDEKAIGRGHQDVTGVLDGDTGELLQLHEGRKKASLQAFFDRLTEAQKARIQAVCVDRLATYVECIEAEVPEAAIVYDKSHLLCNCHRLVNQVRRQEWNKARRATAPSRPN